MTDDELTAASGEDEARGQEEAPESPKEGAAEDVIVDELAEARAQAEEYLRHLQRVQADFINYKRRVDQERAEQQRFAAADLMKQILPVLDDLDRAEAARPEADGSPAIASWADGVVRIVRKLETILAGQGLTRIEALGKDFDPTEHEAIMRQPGPPEMAGKVVAEAQRGYRLHDRVLRPAMVVVGAVMEPSADTGASQDEPPGIPEME